MPLPEPAEGEILVRNSYLSVDPYMRSRMRDVKSYVPPYEVGKVMDGGAVGQVIASKRRQVRGGLLGAGPQRLARALRVQRRRPVPGGPELAPVSTALGVLGMPGLTAYAGLMDIGKPQEGETMFVSGAAGAVGSAVGQMARLQGLPRGRAAPGRPRRSSG